MLVAVLRCFALEELILFAVVVESVDLERGDREIAVRVGLDHKTVGGIIARSRLTLRGLPRDAGTLARRA